MEFVPKGYLLLPAIPEEDFTFVLRGGRPPPSLPARQRRPLASQWRPAHHKWAGLVAMSFKDKDKDHSL